MTDHQEPPRLFEADDAPAELRAWLDEAHADVLGADAVGRVAAGVQIQIGGGGTPPAGSGTSAGPGGSGPATPTGTSVLPSSTAGKMATGLMVAALAGGGLWWAQRGAPEAPPPGAEPAAAVTVAEPRSADGTPESGRAEPAEDLDAEADSGEERNPAPGTAADRPRLAAPKPSASADDAPPAERTSDMVEEHRLLRSARAALADDPRRAYALTQEHKRRFPQGMLAQEREVIAIEALSRQGKSDAAKSRAHRFDEDYPDSPHRDRVDSAARDRADGRP